MYLMIGYLADKVETGENGKLNITGVFSGITGKEIPFKHRNFTIIARIGGDVSEVGPHRIGISLIDVNNKEIGTPAEVSINLKKEQRSPIPPFCDVIIRVTSADFLKEGIHEFVISVDDVYIGSIPFLVTKTDPNS